jgi:hypothetical protein
MYPVNRHTWRSAFQREGDLQLHFEASQQQQLEALYGFSQPLPLSPDRQFRPPPDPISANLRQAIRFRLKLKATFATKANAQSAGNGRKHVCSNTGQAKDASEVLARWGTWERPAPHKTQILPKHEHRSSGSFA